jgi:hypothetical protein
MSSRSLPARAGRGRVAEDEVWAKLASRRDGARLASGRLFALGR